MRPGNVVPGTRTYVTGAPDFRHAAAGRPAVVGNMDGRRVRHMPSVHHRPLYTQPLYTQPPLVVTPPPPLFSAPPVLAVHPDPFYSAPSPDVVIVDRGRRRTTIVTRDHYGTREAFAWMVVVLAIIFTFGLALIAHDSLFGWANGRRR